MIEVIKLMEHIIRWHDMIKYDMTRYDMKVYKYYNFLWRYVRFCDSTELV